MVAITYDGSDCALDCGQDGVMIDPDLCGFFADMATFAD